MAHKSESFWRRGFHYLIDGTFREVFDALRKKDNSEDRRQWDYDPHGFRTLTNTSFVTHKIETYIDLIKNPEEWQAFDTENMNKFFHDAIILFPYDRVSAQDADDKTAKPHLEAPSRFFRVQQEMIERRFPCGRNLTPGDADLRDIIETLRYIFAKNFNSLILLRRKLALRFVGLDLLALSTYFVLILALKPMLGAVGVAFALPLVLGVLGFFSLALIVVFYVVYWRTLELFGNYRDQYQAAIQSSCLLLGRNLQVRQQDIIAMIPLIFREADDDKFKMLNEGRLNKWPDEARKWTKLAFWLAGRVEYNELSMQLHMWRIRRLHFGLQWWATLLTKILSVFSYLGLLLSAGLFFSALVVLWKIWAGEYQGLAAIALVSIGVTVICGIYIRLIVRASDNKHRVDLDLIEKNIMTKNIQGHTDVNLHDIVAQRLYIDKSALLYEEGKAKR